MSQNYSNVAVETTLSVGINASTTTITVGATTGFPSPNFTLVIDQGTASEELVLVTAVGGTTLTVTRGYDGTTGTSHSTGATVRHAHSAKDFKDSRDHEAATAVHGATGAVVGTTNAQTLTNKTISADSNTLGGVAASSFVLSNASGNIDGAAAQKAIPAGVVVGDTDTQTLTNKTLTAPALTTPTASGSLAGFGGAWTAYTPTWGVVSGIAPAIGNGSISGAYIQIGKLVIFRAKITVGSTTTLGSGAYTFGLPVAPNAAYTTNLALGIVGNALDSGVAVYAAIGRLNTGSTVVLDVTATGTAISNSSPFTANSGDVYSLSGTYEAA